MRIGFIGVGQQRLPPLDTLIGLGKALRGRVVIDLSFAGGIRIEFDD